MPSPSTVQRNDLIASYIEQQSTYISRMLGVSMDVARAQVQDIISSRYTPKQISDLRTTSPGNTVSRTGDLLGYIRGLDDKIIAPSGSSYLTPDKGKSIIVQMIEDKVAERSRVKKIQLAAANDGDTTLERRCKYQQASIKINNNSIPGGFASPYNIFYDKGGYNTITSTARCMIARAISITEQLLGGNFAWFSIEELINWVVYVSRNIPSHDIIQQTVRKYKLVVPTVEDLVAAYGEQLRKYQHKPDMSPVEAILRTMTQPELTYLYYVCNLRRLIWTNSEVFLKYFTYVFDHTDATIIDTATPADVKGISGHILNLVTISFCEQLDNCSVADITSKRKDLLPLLVGICRSVEKKLTAMDDLFNTFIYTDVDVPMTDLKPNMLRNTVIISDTDSVIFTASAWADWYSDVSYGITQKSYQITSLVIYWLEHTIAHALNRASVLFGVTGESTSTLSMKNEFTYSVILLYDNKKTYVSMQINQEGVVFTEPKPDIKGQVLKGSSICPSSLQFVEDMIVNHILVPASTHRISAVDLIRRTVEFEYRIKDSLARGETEFLKLTSLKDVRQYKTPDTAFIISASNFWQQVCSVDHGDVTPPAKVSYFSTIKPTVTTLDSLKSRFPAFHSRLVAYMTNSGFPTNILINPMCNRIPEELIPFIDVRAVIWHNIQPIYLTLAKLNIGVGGADKKLLFTDIYT